MHVPLTVASKALYTALAALTLLTIILSLQPSIAVRQLRNLTILASFAIGLALLFADRWRRPALIWAAAGLASGLLYFGYETWTISRARKDRPHENHGRANVSTILLGVAAWPLALPEVVEMALADMGVIGTGAAPSRQSSPDARRSGETSVQDPGGPANEDGAKTESFGYKNAWLAVRASSTEEVTRALLEDAAPSEWKAGVEAAYEWPGMTYGDRVFVTPPLDGWVLCVGTTLFAFADSRPPAFGQVAARLAADLKTEVQFFATHRIVEAHAWARATPAGVVREFLYVGESGETVTDFGARTDAESGVDEFPSESDVMTIAGRWSVDPSEIRSRFPDAEPGVLGRLALPKPPSPTAR